MRTLALVLLSLAVAAPASAQFKVPKKVKDVTGAEKAKPAAAPAATGGGGMLVLDDEVIDQMIKGLRARDAHKAAAAKADTPYGRYQQGKAAYVEAKAKCDAAMQSYPTRVSADPKLAEKNADKNSAYMDKMIAAQQKGDTAAQRMWGDSMAMIFDPACTVKDPPQPSDMYDQQRAVDEGAESASQQASGLDGREMGTAVDRTIAIIRAARRVALGAAGGGQAGEGAQGPDGSQPAARGTSAETGPRAGGRASTARRYCRGPQPAGRGRVHVEERQEKRKGGQAVG